jgi:hypothetical protein
VNITNQNIKWAKSLDIISANTLENDNKTEIYDNGFRLKINDLSLLDQQYYSCFNNESNDVISEYYLIVRSKDFR